MALPGAEGPVWKLQRAIANTYAPLRGVLLILNVLLYAICPVSAVAALPRDPFGSPPYYNSTTLRFPKWHTGSFTNSSLANSTTANSTTANSTIANSLLSTWGSTFTSGSRLVTFFSVHTAQGHLSSSGFHRLPFASQSPQNISILPLFANVTHRRDSTTPMSPSPSRYFRPGNHEATTTRHYTNLSSWSTPILSSSTLVHQEANSSHHSASNASLPAILGTNTTRAHHVIATADLSLAKNSSISSGISSTLPSWLSSGPRSFTPSSHSSSLHGNITRAHGNIITADVSLKNNSSMSSGISSMLPSWLSSGPRSFTPSSHSSSLHGNITRAHGNIITADVSLTNNSSMSSGVLSAPLSPLSSRSPSLMSPLHTGSSTQVSRPSSLPSKARNGLPSASSSTNPSRSRSASITPKPSTTRTPSVTSDPSSLANNLTYSLPPGCKFETWENETFVLVPTERARVAYPHSTVPQAGAVGYDNDPAPYDPGPPPSTTSQAGAAGYLHPTPITKDPIPDLGKSMKEPGPSSRTLDIALGILLGFFPMAIAIPVIMWDIERWRLDKDKKEGRIRRIPKNEAEDMQDIYDAIRNRKWNERLAFWLDDFRGWCRIQENTDFPTLRDKTIKADIKRAKLVRQILRLNAYQGPTFTNEVRRPKNPAERDPGSCNYNNRAEMRGCLDPPLDWPIYNTEGPPRLTHEESLGMAEQLHRPVKSQKIMNGVMKTILKLPEGYERLTLDGKMSYLKQWTKITVSDPRLRFYDGRCAAVGPGNMPLGGQDVDNLWFNQQNELTMEGTKVEPGSDVGEMTDMIPKYETARFVRQNFPTDRFEGVERGAQYDSDFDSMYDVSPPPEPNQGKGKGKAKASTVEELKEGLTFPQRQAMDMQMDHDLQGISDEIIRDWWNEKYLDVGPSQVPPIEDMRTQYWSENQGVGPNVGDYTEWASQPAQSPPQDIEIREPPSSPNSPNSPSSPNDPTNPPNTPNLPKIPPPNTPVGPNSPLEPTWPTNPNGPNTPDDPDSDSNADEQARQTEEQYRQAEEQARQAEEQARQAQQAEEQARQSRQAEEQVRQAEEQARQAEEQARKAEEQAKQAEEQAQQAKEQTQQAEDPVRQAEEHLQQSEKELRKWDEELRDEAQKIRQQNERIKQEKAQQKIREQMRDADKQMHKEEAARRVEAQMQKHAEDMKKLTEELRKSDYRMRADQAEEARARQRVKDWQREYKVALEKGGDPFHGGI